MEIENITEKEKEEKYHKNEIHRVLAHSYFFSFIFFLIGICLDFIFPLNIFKNFTVVFIGFVILMVGTILIIWAQHTSRNLKKENITKETFYQGPYRYTRAPTHFGLLFLTLGFGLVSNALFIVISSVISFLISKLVFLKKEEKMLVEKYGYPYLEYKKEVKI